MRNPVEIDHIDPRWSEGRDYQLVCGLDIDTNFCERDNRLNIQKSNRFLPWRVAYDEVGSIPVNPGDLCQFLDCETGEWVLEEFMGNWWFKQTKNLCGNSRGGQIQRELGLGMFNPERSNLQIENSRKNGIANRDNKLGIFNPLNRQKTLDGAAKENAKRMRPIVVIDSNGVKYEHASLNGGARFHQISAGLLCLVLQGKRAHARNFTAYYLNGLHTREP